MSAGSAFGTYIPWAPPAVCHLPTGHSTYLYGPLWIAAVCHGQQACTTAEEQVHRLADVPDEERLSFIAHAATKRLSASANKFKESRVKPSRLWSSAWWRILQLTMQLQSLRLHLRHADMKQKRVAEVGWQGSGVLLCRL